MNSKRGSFSRQSLKIQSFRATKHNRLEYVPDGMQIIHVSKPLSLVQELIIYFGDATSYTKPRDID